MSQKKSGQRANLPTAEREAYRSWRDRPSGYPEKQNLTSLRSQPNKTPTVTRRRSSGSYTPRSGGSASLYDDRGIRYAIE